MKCMKGCVLEPATSMRFGAMRISLAKSLMITAAIAHQRGGGPGRGRLMRTG